MKEIREGRRPQKMRWVLDIDGCIASNPDFFAFLTYTLTKKGNSHEVVILTARNPDHMVETIYQLREWGIKFDDIVFMENDTPRDFKSQMEWKIAKINDLKPDVWVDNDFKIYKQLLGVDLDMILPEVYKVLI